jgi:hypothetical protein
MPKQKAIIGSGTYQNAIPMKTISYIGILLQTMILKG